MFQLAEITTKDGLVHQGIYFGPKKKSKRAILWVHGLTENFYGDVDILKAFMHELNDDGWGIASFNTRGHDIVASAKKLDPTAPKGYRSISVGSGYEKFTDCIFDIDAGISFLKSQGYTEVILIGYSTGANKVCYYGGTENDSRVIGTVLMSPISDVPIESKQKDYPKKLQQVKKLIANRKGEKLVDDISYLALTPHRFISLFEPGGAEDVFDYYAKKPKLKVFSNIKIPLGIVLAGSDEYSDRPVSDILNVFKKYQNSSNFGGWILDGASHSFKGKEEKLVEVITHWIKTI